MSAYIAETPPVFYDTDLNDQRHVKLAMSAEKLSCKTVRTCDHAGAPCIINDEYTIISSIDLNCI